ALDVGLRQWVKENPPGKADYRPDEPMRAVYLYSETLETLPGINVSALSSVLVTPYFSEVVKKTLKSKESAVRKDEKDLVEKKHPEYRRIIREIAEAKKTWRVDDTRIRGTYEFKMMGGLARMGTRASMHYKALVAEAQRMERDALGKTLTKQTKV